VSSFLRSLTKSNKRLLPSLQFQQLIVIQQWCIVGRLLHFLYDVLHTLRHRHTHNTAASNRMTEFKACAHRPGIFQMHDVRCEITFRFLRGQTNSANKCCTFHFSQLRCHHNYAYWFHLSHQPNYFVEGTNAEKYAKFNCKIRFYEVSKSKVMKFWIFFSTWPSCFQSFTRRYNMSWMNTNLTIETLRSHFNWTVLMLIVIF